MTTQPDSERDFILTGTFKGDVDNQLLRRIRRIQAAIDQLTQTVQTNLSGVTAGGSVRVGTHDDRLLLAPQSLNAGSLFYETDRTTMYIVLPLGTSKVWSPV